MSTKKTITVAKGLNFISNSHLDLSIYAAEHSGPLLIQITTSYKFSFFRFFFIALKFFTFILYFKIKRM